MEEKKSEAGAALFGIGRALTASKLDDGTVERLLAALRS